VAVSGGAFRGVFQLRVVYAILVVDKIKGKV
jgi:hypothetical protein